MSEPKEKPDKSDSTNNGGQGNQGGQGNGRPNFDVLIYHEEKGQDPDHITLREPEVKRQTDR